MESIESFSSPPMKMEEMPPLMQQSNPKKLPEIKDEHHRRFILFLLIRILPLFLTTVVSFIISYRYNNKDCSSSIGPLGGMLIALLTEYFLPAYIHMPENERSTRNLLWMKLAICSLSTALVFIFVFLFSKLWEWSFKSTVVVVLVLSLFLPCWWMIGDLNYRKIWLSGKDEIEDPTGK